MINFSLQKINLNVSFFIKIITIMPFIISILILMFGDYIQVTFSQTGYFYLAKNDFQSLFLNINDLSTIYISFTLLLYAKLIMNKEIFNLLIGKKVSSATVRTIFLMNLFFLIFSLFIYLLSIYLKNNINCLDLKYVNDCKFIEFQNYLYKYINTGDKSYLVFAEKNQKIIQLTHSWVDVKILEEKFNLIVNNNLDLINAEIQKKKLIWFLIYLNSFISILVTIFSYKKTSI